jgi:hypothetical protein
MQLTESLKGLFNATVKQLRGSARRLCMARTVRELGPAGQRVAERALGWNRGTIRKGMHELTSGITCVDALGLRGRKPAEAPLPHLLDDSRAIVESQSQAAPQFRSRRRSTRLSAPAVRRQVIAQKGYTADELPTAETSGVTLHALGYTLTKVAKTHPPKRSPRPTPSSSR